MRRISGSRAIQYDGHVHACIYRSLKIFAEPRGTAFAVGIVPIQPQCGWEIYKETLHARVVTTSNQFPSDLEINWPYCSSTMATLTESFTKVRNPVGKIRAPFTNQPVKATSSQASAYHIEERQTVKTPVPFNSPLSVVVHLVNWTCWTLYFILRLRGIYGSSNYCSWAIYLCEVAFMVQDLQTAFDLSLSLFGPRKVFEHTQYILTGSQAPRVDILVT